MPRRPTRIPSGPEKIYATTAYRELANKIRKEILSGRLNPGDQLPTESDLSEAYNVGRGTAREAIRSLESHGLVSVRRGVAGGIFVTVPPPDKVKDSLQTGLALLADSSELSAAALMEVRDFLEIPAAEQAALRHTEDDLKLIRAALSPPAELGENQIFACLQQFHIEVIRAAHNPMLNLIAEPIIYVVEDRFGSKRSDRVFHGVDRDHQEIVSHFEARDQAGAREAMRAHLRSVRRTLETLDRERLVRKRRAKRPAAGEPVDDTNQPS